jgi:queuine/archaeosine tRNA-ribosyltransferase
MILEILKHDGPSRLGILHFNDDKINTPNFFSILTKGSTIEHDIYLARHDIKTARKPIVLDYGSLTCLKICRANFLRLKFGILPDEHVGFYVPRKIAELAVKNTIEFAGYYKDFGAVIQGSRYADLREECARRLSKHPFLTIADGNKLIKNPRLLVEVLTRVREVISPNSALYFPFAPSHMFYILAYMGVDLFDSADAILKAGENKITTTRGFSDLNNLEELSCPCEVCRGSREPGNLIGDFKGILKHNFYTLTQAVKEIREAIRKNEFRNLVEEKAACDVTSMTALRLLDREKQDFLERYTPVAP